MFCKQCGSKIDDDSLFCSSCGHSLRKVETGMADIQKNSSKLLAIATNGIEDVELPDDAMKRHNLVFVLIGSSMALFLGLLNSLGAFSNLDVSSFRILGIILLVFRIVLLLTLQDSIKKRNRDTTSWSFYLFFFPPLFLITLGILGVKSYDHAFGNTQQGVEKVKAHAKYLIQNGHWTTAVNYCSQVLKHQVIPEILFHRATALFNLKEYMLVKKDLDRLVTDAKYREKAEFWMNKIQPYL